MRVNGTSLNRVLAYSGGPHRRVQEAATGVESSYPAPTQICWWDRRANEGPRNAEITFEHESGKIDLYEWSFHVNN